MMSNIPTAPIDNCRALKVMGSNRVRLKREITTFDPMMLPKSRIKRTVFTLKDIETSYTIYDGWLFDKRRLLENLLHPGWDYWWRAPVC